jgi:hypothetical protein
MRAVGTEADHQSMASTDKARPTYITSDAAFFEEVELEELPNRGHRPSRPTRAVGRRRGDRTPVLALVVATGSAVLALIAIATDDAALTRRAPVAAINDNPKDPRDAAAPPVPDGVPCPRQPVRIDTPVPC